MTAPPSGGEHIVWLNGQFIPAGQAVISPFDRGFLYGDGLFETMRAQHGTVLYLEEHLERLRESAEFLRIKCKLSLRWQHLFRELLHRNGLDHGIAAAKIVLTRGIAPGMGLPAEHGPTLCLMVHAYNGPDSSTYGHGWKLAVFPQGYSPPLSRHKSLNYLYYMLARQYALDRDADEAVILDSVGNVAETAAGSLFIRIDDSWWRPASQYQLRGTTTELISTLLAAKGSPVTPRDLRPDDLSSAGTIWVVNSLMGIMPIREVEGHPIPFPAAEEAAWLRDALFRQAQGRACSQTGRSIASTKGEGQTR